MRKQYVDFLDRFDGGGAGRTGNSFEGGGLLSALANIFATPYGSEDQARRAQRRQALGLLDTAAAPAQAKVKPGAPFAPRTAPPAGDITVSALPPVYKAPPYDPARMLEFNQPPARLPAHLTGPKMGMPPIPSHLTGPKMGAQQTINELDANSVAMTELPGAVGTGRTQSRSSYTRFPALDGDTQPMLAYPSGVQPVLPNKDTLGLPAEVLLDTPTAARHMPLSNFTDADYVALAAENPAFEAWLIGQPNVLSLPDQAKRFLNLQLINQARQ